MIIDTAGEEATLKTKRETVLDLFIKKVAELDELAETYDRMDTTVAFLTGLPKEGGVEAIEVRREEERKRRKYAASVEKNDQKKTVSEKGKNATKKEVFPALVQLVADNPGVEKKEAESFVEDKMRELGLGIRGVAVQIERYLKDAQFRLDESGRVFLARQIAVD